MNDTSVVVDNISYINITFPKILQQNAHYHFSHYKKIKQFDEITLNRRMYSDSVVYGKPLYVFFRINCFCVRN